MQIFVRQTDIQGVEKLQGIQSPLILVSNHRGRFDGIWIWYYFAKMNRSNLIYMRIVTGESFFRIPIIGWYLRQMKCFPVEKGRGVDILDPMVDALKKGQIVTIFPEGKMQKKPGHKGDAKRGVGYLIWKSKVPVLPVYINYIKRYKYLPIWEMTFKVGDIKPYSVKSENELKTISEKVLDSVYKLAEN
jgi:1-acyl-sn-glycerol-3-phosphate acyltransferase